MPAPVAGQIIKSALFVQRSIIVAIPSISIAYIEAPNIYEGEESFNYSLCQQSQSVSQSAAYIKPPNIPEEEDADGRIFIRSISRSVRQASQSAVLT